MNSEQLAVNSEKLAVSSEQLAVAVAVSSGQLEVSSGPLRETLMGWCNERNKGNVHFSGGELKPGIYLYTLIADDMEVGTKRMILTK